jgi:predicted DNA-binding transcriptional regulator YafY
MPKRYFERLQTIDYLIRIKGTGKPAQLAKRLRISERTLYEFLKMMKDLGAPIEYDRYKESYYYTEKGGFNIRFVKNLITTSTMVFSLFLDCW